MIVDPNTGQPIEATTMGGQIGLDAMAASGTDIPLAQDLLSSLPTVSHTMMWNMRRVSNTMVKGPRRGATSARGLRQTFSPAAFNRLGSVSNIEPPSGSRTYSPFNVLANYGNKGAVRAANSKGRTGRYIAGHLGPAGSDGTWFSAGSAGRLSTMGRVYGARQGAFDRMLPNIGNAFKELNPTQYNQALTRWGVANAAPGGYGAAVKRSMGLSGMTIDAFGRNEAAQAVGMSMRGSISQRAAGFVHASTMSHMGVGVREATNLAAPGSNFAKGAAKFDTIMKEGSGMAKFGARSARFAPALARAAGPIGWALLARDVAVMTGKVFSSAAKTAIDAGNSVKGSIDKPIMGMGFRDNMVASTSRQRGVMAISNSRLNMRSALGNEAAGIHAAWG
jgi:hypothetical protein